MSIYQIKVILLILSAESSYERVMRGKCNNPSLRCWASLRHDAIFWQHQTLACQWSCYEGAWLILIINHAIITNKWEYYSSCASAQFCISPGAAKPCIPMITLYSTILTSLFGAAEKYLHKPQKNFNKIVLYDTQCSVSDVLSLFNFLKLATMTWSGNLEN